MVASYEEGLSVMFHDRCEFPSNPAQRAPSASGSFPSLSLINQSRVPSFGYRDGVVNSLSRVGAETTTTTSLQPVNGER